MQILINSQRKIISVIETSNGISTSKTSQIDQWGRPTQYQQITNVGTAANPDFQTYTSSYQYNLSGAMTQETYPSDRVVKNTFDSNGDLMRVFGKATTNSIEKTYVNSFNFTASGYISTLKLGNGKWESVKYNNRFQVTELGLGNSSVNASLWKVNYEYGELESNGNIDTSKNIGILAKQTISFNGLSQPFVQKYKYDSLYRLIEANEKQGTTENWKQSFTYDRYGNRLGHNKYINGNQITLNNISHPTINSNTNRFNNGQGYLYDKVGNVTKDAENRTFSFDGNNKQIFVTDANNNAVGEYFYDGEGKRVKKKVYSNGQHLETIIFVYSGGKLAEEYSTKSPPQEKKIKYMTEDHLSTPRIITDENGEVLARRDFMPFGENIDNTVGARSTQSFKYASSQDDVRQKFTGYQKDAETGLDFAEARMYENQHGRFTAVDPLLASGKDYNPQSFNRYVYVLNNPLNLTDPTGLCPEDPCEDDDEVLEFETSQYENLTIYENNTASYVGDNGEIVRLDLRHLDSKNRNQLIATWKAGGIFNKKQEDLIKSLAKMSCHICGNDDDYLDHPDNGNQNNRKSKKSKGKGRGIGLGRFVRDFVKGAKEAIFGKKKIKTLKRKSKKKKKRKNKSNIDYAGFNSIMDNPLKNLVNRTADEIEKTLGKGWTRSRYGRTGDPGWQFTDGTGKTIFYHGKGGRHKSEYWGFSSGKTGRHKFVRSNYVGDGNERATINFIQ